ncbi:MAG: sulfotransferase domain-containing protein [Candidatus Omnitrophota bacterium]|nr:sulfotransferase domain-containing protein [Candidatus Omnitrophota bacterium]
MFLIIGAQRSGTSALHTCLSRHPLLFGAPVKEIGYFAYNCKYGRGDEWYERELEPGNIDAARMTFETTPEYAYFPWCAERIHVFDPNIRLIMLVRDPVDRAYSAWQMFLNAFRQRAAWLVEYLSGIDSSISEPFYRLLEAPEPPDFETAVAAELSGENNLPIEPSYIRRGLYGQQIERYLGRFGRDAILILDAAQFATRPAETLHRACRFLEIPYDSSLCEPVSLVNRGEYSQPVPVEAQEQLREYYRPHNEVFFNLIGQDFSWAKSEAVRP